MVQRSCKEFDLGRISGQVLTREMKDEYAKPPDLEIAPRYWSPKDLAKFQ